MSEPERVSDEQLQALISPSSAFSPGWIGDLALDLIDARARIALLERVAEKVIAANAEFREVMGEFHQPDPLDEAVKDLAVGLSQPSPPTEESRDE